MTDAITRPPAALEPEGPLFEAVCCRSWPVYLGARMLPCGYCGVTPTIIGTWAWRHTES